MAVLGTSNPTLLDLAKVHDPQGRIMQVAEILNETNPILQDMTVIEGNLPTGHMSPVRTGIPAATWRKMYGFTQPTKSTTATVTDNTGMLEQYAEVDAAMSKVYPDMKAFRRIEDRAHIEGMNQEMAETLFYGNETTEPEAFTGFAPRYNSLSASNAENIVNAGGAGSDNGSIWLVVWGPGSVHGIVPKGSSAGLKVEDKGLVTKQDTVGGTTGLMEVYRTRYCWDVGLHLKDWRYVVRIANIDKSLLSTVYTAGAFATGAHLPNLMFDAMDLIPNLSFGRPVFYMARTMLTKFRQQLAAAVQSSTLTTDNVGGIITQSWHGIPVRRCDALSADEAAVA